MRWLATALAVFIGGASILVAIWATSLIVDPPEEIHFEVALPALVMAGLGAIVAVALWRRGI